MKVFHYIYVRARARFLLSYSTLGNSYGHSWVYAKNILDLPDSRRGDSCLTPQKPDVRRVFAVLNMAGYSATITTEIAIFSAGNQALRA